MEKEKKGLLGMLAAFWKDQTEEMRQGGIGFQVEKEPQRKGNDFVFSEEERKAFQKEEKRDFFAAEKAFLLAEPFWEKREEQQTRQETVFFREETAEKRKIVPVAEEERVFLQERFAEEESETTQERTWKKDEPRQERELDVETLMQEITKKLWEERESCGRRLR